ncbi:MAG: potassium transporter Kef [Planctomycetes bacterium RBG_13_62_9]|nr:MAG: potassium transporter Kef [Planctomycetes bacterium RBG_13_62_9]
MESPWLIAALWVGLALLASMISIRTAISVALIEILVGAAAGNVIPWVGSLMGTSAKLETTPWINFLAGFGSILLTFLAGAEIEPDVLRKHWRPSLAIGFVSFLMPFLAAMTTAYWLLHWSPQASMIGGVALSTTSVAVVYAVMVETGLNKRDLGKLILASCFVTDLGTVLALGVMFANYNWRLVLFLGVSAVVMPFAPHLTRRFLRRYEGQVSEPEIKLLLLMLFVLGGLAAQANSEAVLPAYVLGLVVAGELRHHKETVYHIRVAVFALLTPFYFLKAGALIKADAVGQAAVLILVLLLVKVAAKFVGVYPTAKLFRMDNRVSMYTTLLMSTGLTFGTISAMFGLSRNLIDASQYSTLVVVVIASAVVPTLIAQKWFQPQHELSEETANGV